MITPVASKAEIFSADQQDLIEWLNLAQSYLTQVSNITEQYRQTHPQLATDVADAVHYTVEALSQVEG